mmetsp:Transcript_73697/g.194343  ORF Transcript_73697/g.194343 Transcript_73697/m.194343 type:complete len:315 (+) Transcript_73697:815-1759(+)
MRAIPQPSDLGLAGCPTEDAGRLDLCWLPKCFGLLVDLLAELAGGRHHDSRGAHGTLLQLVRPRAHGRRHDGRQKGRRLAAARLCDADEVAAREGDGDRLRLDGRGLLVAVLPDAFHELLAETRLQVPEGDDRAHDVGPGRRDPQLLAQLVHLIGLQIRDLFVRRVELSPHDVVLNFRVVDGRQRLDGLVAAVLLLLGLDLLLVAGEGARGLRVGLEVRGRRVIVLVHILPMANFSLLGSAASACNLFVDPRHEGVQRINLPRGGGRGLLLFDFASGPSAGAVAEALGAGLGLVIEVALVVIHIAVHTTALRGA